MNGTLNEEHEALGETLCEDIEGIGAKCRMHGEQGAQERTGLGAGMLLVSDLEDDGGHRHTLKVGGKGVGPVFREENLIPWQWRQAALDAGDRAMVHAAHERQLAELKGRHPDLRVLMEIENRDDRSIRTKLSHEVEIETRGAAYDPREAGDAAPHPDPR